MEATIEADPREAEARIVLAWQRYLRATRGCPAGAYSEIEEAAWQRLQERLASIRASRAWESHRYAVDRPHAGRQ